MLSCTASGTIPLGCFLSNRANGRAPTTSLRKRPHPCIHEHGSPMNAGAHCPDWPWQPAPPTTATQQPTCHPRHAVQACTAPNDCNNHTFLTHLSTLAAKLYMPCRIPPKGATAPTPPTHRAATNADHIYHEPHHTTAPTASATYQPGSTGPAGCSSHYCVSALTPFMPGVAVRFPFPATACAALPGLREVPRDRLRGAPRLGPPVRMLCAISRPT